LKKGGPKSDLKENPLRRDETEKQEKKEGLPIETTQRQGNKKKESGRFLEGKNLSFKRRQQGTPEEKEVSRGGGGGTKLKKGKKGKKAIIKGKCQNFWASKKRKGRRRPWRKKGGLFFPQNPFFRAIAEKNKD